MTAGEPHAVRANAGEVVGEGQERDEREHGGGQGAQADDQESDAGSTSDESQAE